MNEIYESHDALINLANWHHDEAKNHFWLTSGPNFHLDAAIECRKAARLLAEYAAKCAT